MTRTAANELLRSIPVGRIEAAGGGRGDEFYAAVAGTYWELVHAHRGRPSECRSWLIVDGQLAAEAFGAST